MGLQMTTDQHACRELAAKIVDDMDSIIEFAAASARGNEEFERSVKVEHIAAMIQEHLNAD